MKKLLIIIPAYNEEKSIERVVDNLIKNFSQYDYLVVDDGSTDNTMNLCREKGYNLLALPINLGLSGAFQAGARYAYEEGYEMAIQLDGDGQHNPIYISDMVTAMENKNVDIVIGSRFLTKIKQKKNMRLIGGQFISACIKLTTNKNISDPTSGMRLYDRKVLKEFAYVMNYTPEPDTISFLIRTGVRVEEIPVEMEERQQGESYLNVKNALKYMLHMCISILLVQGFRSRRR